MDTLPLVSRRLREVEVAERYQRQDDHVDERQSAGHVDVGYACISYRIVRCSGLVQQRVEFFSEGA